MLPKNGLSVKKNYFLYSIIKIYDVNYYIKHRKNIFCNLTIFELVNEIEDFESLWYPVLWGTLHLQKLMYETELDQAYRKKGVTLGFLSTHPSNLSREQNVAVLMPEMLRIRSAHGCCSLPEDNPYENFKKFKNLIKDQQGNFNYEWDKRQVLRNAMKKPKKKKQAKKI